MCPKPIKIINTSLSMQKVTNALSVTAITVTLEQKKIEPLEKTVLLKISLKTNLYQ